MSHWHFLISSYYLTVSNGHSLTTLKSVEFTLSSGSFKWEGGRVHQFYLVSHWHFLISSYYLTVSNGCSLTALKSVEFTLSSGSFKWEGGRVHQVLPGVTLTFPYIFLLFDCFEWALIDCIEKCRVYSELWQFWMGGREGGREGGEGSSVLPGVTLTFPYIFLLFRLFRMGTHWLHWKVKSSLWALAVSNGREGGRGSSVLPGVTLTFPYIFLLFDCFEWVLIDCIEKCRVHSELWQFQMGGRGGREGSSVLPGVTLTFPYIFLLFDCFEWVLIDHMKKRRVHSELWQF